MSIEAMLAEQAGSTYKQSLGVYQFYTNELEKFAELVRADEREACAKVAESYEPLCDSCPSGVATAIRAREEK